MAQTARQRTQVLAPGALFQLFIADIPNGPILYFHGYTEPDPNIITFQAHDYAPWALTADGWDYNTDGAVSRPRLTISDFDSTITALMLQYDDLIGTVVTRKRTFRENLDDWPGGDNTQEYPLDIYTVDSYPSGTPGLAYEFELIAPIDNPNIFLPNRQVAGFCPWTFRGPDCTYGSGVPKQVQNADGSISSTTGTLVNRNAYNSGTTYALNDYAYTLSPQNIRIYWVSLANANTSPLTDITKWKLSVCGKSVNDCKLHFGANAVLPFGGFPSGRIPSG